MTQPWVRQLQRMGLLALLLFGGPGVPGVDALLFHGGSAGAWRNVPEHHVEPSSTFCHPERCLIGFAALRTRFVPEAAGPVVAAPVETWGSVLPPGAPAPRHEPSRLGLPRAPPPRSLA